ncbi:hypothetical protein TRFO_02050 [Tritrichomonas foetus]|uniref:Uncharacterized protein n=1 Tax=Tritrichomonas foetus TaxID=1144522 RepID=A0A1J4JF53_9EUKA|nr:hypothetical protein TRFO_02050 [Tritrichomonas foetus]|eukprot:OHS96927.1 hypothetical protein TRFO_02050 [Tritrichomonas foetus]
MDGGSCSLPKDINIEQNILHICCQNPNPIILRAIINKDLDTPSCFGKTPYQHLLQSKADPKTLNECIQIFEEFGLNQTLNPEEERESEEEREGE